MIFGRFISDNLIISFILVIVLFIREVVNRLNHYMASRTVRELRTCCELKRQCLTSITQKPLISPARSSS